uniref:FTH domain-containing protein n=1 Tax=Steinernema glaseri TaxID=37863 RepID=A0A1I7ZLE0_9BILA
MNCLLNPIIMNSILAFAQDEDHEAVIQADEHLKKLLLQALKENAMMSAFFFWNKNKFYYQFQDDLVSHVSRFHEHLENPLPRHANKLETLNVSEKFEWEGCGCAPEMAYQYFPITSLSNERNLKFKKLYVERFDGPLSALPPSIQRSFQSVHMSDTKLHERRSDSFFQEVLGSPELRRIIFYNTSISDTIRDSLAQRIEKCDLESLQLDLFGSDKLLEAALLSMLKTWKSQRNPTLYRFHSRIHMIRGRFNSFGEIQKIGRIENEHTVVIEHEFIEGLTATISFGFDCVWDYNAYVRQDVINVSIE